MSTPPFDPDDPRLTAYALGELDETECAAVEKTLVGSPEARSEVGQIQAFARLLATEYAEEQRQYLAALRAPESLPKIIPFRSGREARWRGAIVPALKVAALVAVSACLVYLTARRPQPSAVEIAGSRPAPTALPTASAPLVAMHEPTTDARAAAGNEQAGSAEVADSASQPAPEPPDLAKPRADTLLAESKTQSRGAAASFATTRAFERPRPLAFATPAAQLDQVAAASSAAVRAADQSARPPLTVERFAQSVVRLRSPDAGFFAGVIVSADGLILSASPFRGSALHSPYTARLADGREFPAAAEPPGTDGGWVAFRIKAAALPVAPLANDGPVADEPLSAPIVDPQSGALSFLRIQATVARSESDAPSRGATVLSMAGETGFAFNAAGQLLVVEHAAAKSAGNARRASAATGFTSDHWLARPFTPAERSALRRAIERTNVR